MRREKSSDDIIKNNILDELPVGEASKKPAKKTTSQKKKNIDHPQKQNIPVVSM